MRHDTFYLARTDACYADGPEGFRPQNSADAQRIAVEQATHSRKAVGVYEVKLIGIANPPSAVFTPVELPPTPRKRRSKRK